MIGKILQITGFKNLTNKFHKTPRHFIFIGYIFMTYILKL